MSKSERQFHPKDSEYFPFILWFISKPSYIFSNSQITNFNMSTMQVHKVMRTRLVNIIGINILTIKYKKSLHITFILDKNLIFILFLDAGIAS